MLPVLALGELNSLGGASTGTTYPGGKNRHPSGRIHHSDGKNSTPDTATSYKSPQGTRTKIHLGSSIYALDYKSVISLPDMYLTRFYENLELLPTPNIRSVISYLQVDELVFSVEVPLGVPAPTLNMKFLSQV